MVTLAGIRGQQRAVEHLQRAIAQDRVAHAYLFCGPRGVGKYTTGLALAAALNCESAPGVGCASCVPCTKIADNLHPDVQTLERQGAAQIIPIDTIRSQVIPQLGKPPHEGKARVFLIEEAASLMDASANALLKTLEEPPPRTHFVLCTTAPDQLLPTIRSRCQRVPFVALPAALRSQLTAGDESAAELETRVATLIEASRSDHTQTLHDAAADAATQRADLAATLIRLSERLHEAARDAAMDARLDAAARLGRQAQIAMETHFSVTQHNAHGQLALESMLHQMRAALPVAAD